MLFMDIAGKVAAVVENHIRPLIVIEQQSLRGTPPVFLFGFAFPREYRNVCLGDGRCRVILGRENIAGRPTYFGAQFDESSINTAVWMVMCRDPAMRAPFSGLSLPYFSRRPSARAFLFSENNFLPAPVGQRQVLNFVFFCDNRRGHLILLINSLK